MDRSRRRMAVDDEVAVHGREITVDVDTLDQRKTKR